MSLPQRLSDIAIDIRIAQAEEAAQARARANGALVDGLPLPVSRATAPMLGTK